MTDFLTVATHIGNRLCRDAIWHEDRCNWFGASMEPLQGRWMPAMRSFGASLYDGTAGIGLFLSCLHRRTGDALFRHTAAGAFANSHRQFDPAAGGFYSGGFGIGWALAHGGRAMGDDALVTQGLALVNLMLAREEHTSGFDVTGGDAGVVGPLLDLHALMGGAQLFDGAVRAGERLFASASRRDEGWSWSMPPSGATGSRDLCGLAHGASGAGWAFTELYAATGEARYRDGARQAFRYEQHWFVPAQDNWPDLREGVFATGGDPATAPCPQAWCHGAPGIGLTRLRALEVFGEEHRPEALAAIRATTRGLQTMGDAASSFCLCHGMAGNAELLLYASRAIDRSHAALASQVGELGQRKYDASGGQWPCGVLNGGETPNLMLGLAGIGLFYLRLSGAEGVPLVLLPAPAQHVRRDRSESGFPANGHDMG